MRYAVFIVFVLFVLAPIAFAEELAPYWARVTVVRPVLSASDNVTTVNIVSDGGSVLVYIRGRFDRLTANSSFVCQSWGGLRAFAPGFPRVKVIVDRIRFADILVAGAPYQNVHYPILVLGHGDERVLAAQMNLVYNPVVGQVYAEVVVAVYNVEEGQNEWTLSLVELNGTSPDDIDKYDLSVDFQPTFYSFTVNNETTVVFGWKVFVSYHENSTLYTHVYTVAYETLYTLNLTYADLLRYVNSLRGWWVWVGAGLNVYVEGFSVQNCAFVGNESVQGGFYEYVLRYPVIQSLEPDTYSLWYLFQSGSLENYTRGGSIETIAEIDLSGAYSYAIPLLFALGVGAATRKLSGDLAALGVASVTALALSVMFGWDPAVQLVLVVSAALAAYALRSGGG